MTNNVDFTPIFVDSNNVIEYCHIAYSARTLDMCSKSPMRFTPTLMAVMAIMTAMLSAESNERIAKDIEAKKIFTNYTINSSEKTNYNHILRRLSLLAKLNDGWNNDVHAVKISAITIERIKEFVANIDDLWLEGWNVFPCTNGSVIMDLAKNSIVDATINFAENGVSAFMQTKFDFFSFDNVSYTDERVKLLFEKVLNTRNLCVKFLK